MERRLKAKAEKDKAKEEAKQQQGQRNPDRPIPQPPSIDFTNIDQDELEEMIRNGGLG